MRTSIKYGLFQNALFFPICNWHLFYHIVILGGDGEFLTMFSCALPFEDIKLCRFDWQRMQEIRVGGLSRSGQGPCRVSQRPCHFFVQSCMKLRQCASFPDKTVCYITLEIWNFYQGYCDQKQKRNTYTLSKI